jgi:hypothetical protein
MRLLREMRTTYNLLGPAQFGRYGLALIRHAPEILHSRSLVSADTSFADVAMVRMDGLTFALPGRLFCRELFGRRVYFPEGFDIARGDTVLDLGANNGLFSLIAAKKGARVISVEAQDIFRDSFNDIMKRNMCKAELHCGMVGIGGLLGDAGIASVNLDQVLANIPRVDFLKCDIEGSEFALLQEYPQWLSKVRKIAMEVHTEFGDTRELLSILQAHGFTAELRDNDMKPVSRVIEASGYLFASCVS